MECKKGEAYDKIGEVQIRHAQDKKGEQKCFQLLDSKESKANGTEIIIPNMAQLE